MRVQNSANETEGPTDWLAVNWRAVNRRVRNLRGRIFRATKEGDHKKVRNLQKLMLRSRSNTLSSVRRVTQDNAGRNTAGVDKVLVKTPEARSKLVDEVMSYQPWRAKPAKRVYIPKSPTKLRPLGIPTIMDRCLQARVKNALEPEWEAKFEVSSYGFRPGRGCHDAMATLHNICSHHKGKKRWIVDADIKGAFDNIDHEYLLNVLKDTPGRELVRQWLKAGYVEDGVKHDTPAGTPQGGVISPLLANIALHGMEEALGIARRPDFSIIGNRALVRYADDFVALCESREDAEEVVKTLKVWLKKRGLELSEEKTRIVHLTEGFDFLGFNVRLYKAKTKSSGYKLLIKPSKASVKAIRRRLKEECRSLIGANAQAVVSRLNPIIRGWSNYFRVHVSKETYDSLDNWMFFREQRWTKRTHATKSWKWRKRYWGRFHPRRNDNWVFGDKQTGTFLYKFSWTKIRRHIKVKGNYSPDDPTLRDYWEKRRSRATYLPPYLQRVAFLQGFKCPVCGQGLFNDEELHKHHMILDKENKDREKPENLRLVHLYCHQQIHAGRGTRIPQKARELISVA